MPQRTPSDLVFSVPIEEKILLGAFSNHECSNNEGSSVNKDSLAGSETEEESTDNTNLPFHDSILSVFSTNPRPRSSLGPSHKVHFATARDNTPGQLETLESLGGCIALPLALKEFQEMFNDNDDIYPPDFPMSLRS